MDREVLDKTGITDRYSFDLDWTQGIQAAMRAGETHSPRPDLTVVLAAVKRLGLRLEPRRAPVKFLVIDHVNKEPTPN